MSFRRDLENKREIVVNLNDVTESFIILIVSNDLKLLRWSDFFSSFSDRSSGNQSERVNILFHFKSTRQWHIPDVKN